MVRVPCRKTGRDAGHFARGLPDASFACRRMGRRLHLLHARRQHALERGERHPFQRSSGRPVPSNVGYAPRCLREPRRHLGEIRVSDGVLPWTYVASRCSPMDGVAAVTLGRIYASGFASFVWSVPSRIRLASGWRKRRPIARPLRDPGSRPRHRADAVSSRWRRHDFSASSLVVADSRRCKPTRRSARTGSRTSTPPTPGRRWKRHHRGPNPTARSWSVARSGHGPKVLFRRIAVARLTKEVRLDTSSLPARHELLARRGQPVSFLLGAASRIVVGGSSPDVFQLQGGDAAVDHRSGSGRRRVLHAHTDTTS